MTYSYLWNFGDGQTSTQQDPIHVYALPGVYTVSLTVDGSYSKTRVAYVTVLGTDPGIFKTIKFTNAGRGYPDRIFIDFGDGTTTTSMPVNHDYSLDRVGPPYIVDSTLIFSRNDQSSVTYKRIDLTTLQPNVYY